jgi:hypothetical protein
MNRTSERPPSAVVHPVMSDDPVPLLRRTGPSSLSLSRRAGETAYRRIRRFSDTPARRFTHVWTLHA